MSVISISYSIYSPASNKENAGDLRRYTPILTPVTTYVTLLQ